MGIHASIHAFRLQSGHASDHPLPLILTKLTNNSPALESFPSKDSVLVGSGIGHAFIFLVLLRVDVVQESLAMRRLLVKLDEVAAGTAVRLCHIFQARAFKIVFLSNRCSLHACKDTVQAGYAEQEAL